MKKIISQIPEAIFEVPSLSEEEEWNLVQRMQAAYTEANRLREIEERTGRKRWLTAAIEKAQLEGDDLKGELVLAHMRLAMFLARRYREPDRNWTMEELLSEAYTEMLKCAARFTARKGKRFKSYVGVAIKYRLLIVQGIIIERFERTAKRGRWHPTVELADNLDPRILPSAPADTDDPEPDPREEKILERFRTLTPKQQDALTYFYGLDGQYERKQSEVGAEMGVSPECARMHKLWGLKHLAKALN